MERFSKQNYRHIQELFENETGVKIKNAGTFVKSQTAVVSAALLCLLSLSAFSYAKFSTIAGDQVTFRSVYLGDGVFEITAVNDSNRDLKLQKSLKLRRWYADADVEGDNSRIVMDNQKIKAHSQEIVTVDLSGAYDITALKEQQDDPYYLVFTNNAFAFGQTWMCDISFTEGETHGIIYSVAEEETEKTREEKAAALYPKAQGVGLREEDWIWPTEKTVVSAPFGEQKNGSFSDHINIVGEEGDEVYAVSNGIVTETGFEAGVGNYLILELDTGDKVTVKYGHLKEILAQAGEQTQKGQHIASVGKSGMATGCNLYFAVTVEGENVNPLEK